jgi:hypothetical protein
MINSYRTGITDTEAKQIIDRALPDLSRNVDEYEEVWACLVEASKSLSITYALALLVDQGPDLVLEVHKIRPWVPSPSESVLIMAFMPNVFNAIMMTHQGTLLNENGSLTDELVDHVDKTCRDIYIRSKSEHDAIRKVV